MHIDWWTIALQTVNFVILVWLLQRFLYRPVLRDDRRAQGRDRSGNTTTPRRRRSKAAAHLAASRRPRRQGIAGRARGGAQGGRDAGAGGGGGAPRPGRARGAGACSTRRARRWRRSANARSTKRADAALDLGAGCRAAARSPTCRMQLRAEAWIERDRAASRRARRSRSATRCAASSPTAMR